MDQNAVRSLPLTGIAGDGVTVIEVRVGLRFECQVSPAVELYRHSSSVIEGVDGPEFAVSDYQNPDSGP